MKLVEACLSAMNDRESSFDHCGCPVKLVEASRFKWQEESRKRFLPRWKCCEARGGLFMCQERSRSSFHHCGSSVKLVQSVLSAR